MLHPQCADEFVPEAHEAVTIPLRIGVVVAPGYPAGRRSFRSTTNGTSRSR